MAFADVSLAKQQSHQMDSLRKILKRAPASAATEEDSVLCSIVRLL